VKYFSLMDNGFGNWIIVNPNDPDFAWSGSRWVRFERPLFKVVRPITAQISNYCTPEEAAKVAAEIPDETAEDRPATKTN